MANYATLKASIQDVIKQNGNNEITGALLQQALLAMVNSLGVGYQYSGIATPATNPGTPDQNVFYIASTAGTYTNFGGLVLADGEIAILKYNGMWSKEVTGAATAAQVTELGQQFVRYVKLETSDLTLLGCACLNISAGSYVNHMHILALEGTPLYYYPVQANKRYLLSSTLEWNSNYAAIGFSQNLPVIGNEFDGVVVVSDSPVSNQEYVPNSNGYLLLQYRSTWKSSISIPVNISLQDIDEDVIDIKQDITELDETVDRISSYDELISDVTLLGEAYLNVSAGSYTGHMHILPGYGTVYYYQVEAGKTYKLTSELQWSDSYAAIGFSQSLPSIGGAFDTALVMSNTPVHKQLFLPESDGYILLVYRSSWQSYIYEKTEKTASELQEEIDQLDGGPHSLKGKTIAVFGDSIMQLMAEETSPSLAGNVTLKNITNPSDTNVYHIEDSTVVSGIIYLTSSLTDGPPTVSSVRLEIVNDNQNTLDHMTWAKLQQKILADDVICLGFGGASIAQKPQGITTKYPVIGLLNEGSPAAFDNTVNLPNEVKMLKRLVDDGIRKAPDCCIIWMGINSSFLNENYTLDWAMQLDYATLADDVLGFNDRCKFYGGLRYAVETIYREFPFTNIMIVTPYQTAYADHRDDGTPNNYRGYSFLANVSDAMHQLSDRYSCVFIDAFREIGIANFAWKGNNEDGTRAQAPTLGDLVPLYTKDGLHPSAEGKKLLLKYLVKRIETLYFDKK